MLVLSTELARCKATTVRECMRSAGHSAQQAKCTSCTSLLDHLEPIQPRPIVMSSRPQSYRGLQTAWSTTCCTHTHESVRSERSHPVMDWSCAAIQRARAVLRASRQLHAAFVGVGKELVRNSSRCGADCCERVRGPFETASIPFDVRERPLSRQRERGAALAARRTAVELQ